MIPPEPLASWRREDLLALVAERQRQNAARQRQVAGLTASTAAWRAESEQLTRGGKRPAAPFSKGTREPAPKRPGRKPGSGLFRFRETPPPEAITEPPVDVKGILDACPACGGRLEEARGDGADRTELPHRPRPQVTRYRVWVCRCTVCGTQVRGQHPTLAPHQYGATAHRRGPGVLAVGHALHDGVGIPGRKVPAVLAAVTGVQLTQGALTPEALRRAAGVVGTAYALVRAAVPAAPVVPTDDTGGRVGGAPAYLMAFETDAATVYQSRPRPRHEEVQEVIPVDDDGVRVTDRGRSYDAREFEGVAQQKGLAHLMRSRDDVLATKKGRARDFGEPLKGLLQDARALWREHRDSPVAEFKAEAEALQAEGTYQRRDRCLRDADNQRLRTELGWHHDRGNVRRFWADPRIAPTNHRAERALRPAVMARKVSHCSKTGEGAHAVAAFTSVVGTLAKNGLDSLVNGLDHLFRAPTVQAVAP